MNTIPLLLAILAMTPCDKITLDARMNEDLNSISGKTHCVGAKSDSLKTENYLAWLNAKEATNLNDVNTPWFYPDGYQPGHMQIEPFPNGNSHHFITKIPWRAGALGRSSQAIYLLGGWHPSYTVAGVLTRQSFHYRVEIPKGVAALVGDNLY